MAISPGGRPADASPIGTPGGRQNWVDKVGGLPRYVREVAHALMRKRGMTESRAIQVAIGVIRNWAEGKGNVSPKVRAAAAATIAEWEGKRARAHALAADAHPHLDLAAGRAPVRNPFRRKKKTPPADGATTMHDNGDEVAAMAAKIHKAKPGLTMRQCHALAVTAVRRRSAALAAMPGRYALVDLATGDTTPVTDPLELAMATPPNERAESRRKLADQGKALPDGSFPVPNVEYLRKAVRAVGRADPSKRPALARLLWRRAKALGALDVVKGTWVERELGHGSKAA